MNSTKCQLLENVARYAVEGLYHLPLALTEGPNKQFSTFSRFPQKLFFCERMGLNPHELTFAAQIGSDRTPTTLKFEV